MSGKSKRPPRRLHMNRARRLQSARRWLATQAGRTPVQTAKAYRKWFGVDWPCAIQELGTLGIHLDPEWVKQLYRSLEGARKSRAEKQAQEEAGYNQDSDELFAYIAGYTPGGTPFGITWEEWRQIEAEEGRSAEPECPF